MLYFSEFSVFFLLVVTKYMDFDLFERLIYTLEDTR